MSGTGVLVSTESWFNKIAIRHSHAYHPLLNVQTWIRLPVGIVYSLVPVAAGAGVMVGGCALDAAGDGKGALCQLSVVGGIAIMSTAPRVLEGALRPDLRHWEEVPAAVVLTRVSEPKLEPCLGKVPGNVQRLL
jgi:predicted anti-sigma-YlaC factor YlaD